MHTCRSDAARKNNTEIALRLNNQSSTVLQQWLLEAAE